MPPPERGRNANRRPPKRRPTPPRRTPDPPRRIALDLLAAIRERGAYANLTLPGLLEQARLDERDAALATELGYGTVRWQGTLDAILARCLDRRPPADLDPPVLDVLRLGAYQILRTRIPAYAAVAATVNLAGSVVGEGPARLVNAVLRKVSKRDLEGWITELAPTAGSADEDDAREISVTGLSLRHAHPEWIVRAIADALGPDVAELGAALAANNERPIVHLVARRIARDELVSQVGGEPGPWSPYAVRLPGGGSPHSFAEIRDRRAGVQDEGSQLMALALAGAALGDGEPTGWWLDLCAGPGGKAALLAVLAGDDVRILAADRAPHRAQLVAQATRGQPVAVVSADGLAAPWRTGFADRVLVDAPCSGLGALRRRPDARWRRSPADVDDLVELQRDLLAAAVTAARPGGVVGYVTCSPHPAETVEIVQWAINRGGVSPIDARTALPEMPSLGAGPFVQLWPHRHGTDAMFLALLRVS
ncbi:MAG: hypothetical protein H0T99_02450 [Geodermatophilaceae bacterium]|nr:hypothetical protein [Geodermatophilaceae bacterium]MDQ3474834.1 hypothetical protein [Actinomycetota bacterium]